LKFIWFPGKGPAERTPQYYPIVFTTFWLEYRLWGLNPAGYHLVNIAFHAVNAILLWGVMHRLRVRNGWIIAAIFALHPVHVESVAWITERKNVLSGFFYLASALSYLRFDSESPNRENESRNWWWYAISIVLYIFALMSKSVTCSLPAALMLVMLYQRKPMHLRRLLPLLPLFVIGVAAAMNTAAIERSHVGAYGEEFDFSFAERCFIPQSC
jgi:protein O-mannosyl-transferase